MTCICLKGVLHWKAYAKSLCSLKTVCKAMERLLMKQFVEDELVKIDDPVAILSLVKSYDREKRDNAMKDPTTINSIVKYK